MLCPVPGADITRGIMLWRVASGATPRKATGWSTKRDCRWPGNPRRLPLLVGRIPIRGKQKALGGRSSKTATPPSGLINLGATCWIWDTDMEQSSLWVWGLVVPLVILIPPPPLSLERSPPEHRPTSLAEILNRDIAELSEAPVTVSGWRRSARLTAEDIAQRLGVNVKPQCPEPDRRLGGWRIPAFRLHWATLLALQLSKKGPSLGATSRHSPKL